MLDQLRNLDSEDALLGEIAQELTRLAGTDACDLMLFESPGLLVLRASTRAPEYNVRVRMAKNVGITGHVWSTREPLFIEKNAEKHPLFARYPGIDDVPFEAVAVIPFDDLGVALLHSEAPKTFTATSRTRILKKSLELANDLKIFRRILEAGAQSNKMGALSEVSKTIANSPYLEEILQLLVSLTAQQFNYTVCTVRLLDEVRGELVLRATQAQDRAYQRKRAIKLGESIAGKAIELMRPIQIANVQEEADYIGHDQAIEQGLRSMICVPLTIHDRAVGVMSCYTTEIREFPPDEQRALETLAKQAAMSIEHAKLQVRTTLMQEMHHRVKNNLQQVASLLRLQMRQSHYKSLEETLNDVLGRILAISAVHDLLSRDDLDRVGIRSIAESLVQLHISTFSSQDGQITYKVRGDDVRLDMNQATQVALLINELIQNAFEHGFPEGTSGEIHITIEDLDGDLALWVSNSGVPLPDKFDIVAASHLGLQIVEMLARSLGGRFVIESRLGWTVSEVKFPAQRAT